MRASPLAGHDCRPHEGSRVCIATHAAVSVVAADLLDSAAWDLAQHAVPEVGVKGKQTFSLDVTLTCVGQDDVDRKTGSYEFWLL